MLSGARKGTVEPKERDVFPRSASDHEHCLPTFYRLSDVFDSLTIKYNPETHLRTAVIESAMYGKRNTFFKHEFIRVTVQDKGPSKMKKDMIIDRIGKYSSPASKARFGGYSNFKAHGELAVDELLVPSACSNHTLRSLYDPYTVLSELKFSIDQLSFFQLILISRAVSIYRDKYHLLTAQCYWFAGLTWYSIIQLHFNGQDPDKMAGRRGCFGLFRQKTSPGELEFIIHSVNYFLKNWAPEQKNLQMPDLKQIEKEQPWIQEQTQEQAQKQKKEDEEERARLEQARVRLEQERVRLEQELAGIKKEIKSKRRNKYYCGLQNILPGRVSNGSGSRKPA